MMNIKKSLSSLLDTGNLKNLSHKNQGKTEAFLAVHSSTLDLLFRNKNPLNLFWYIQARNRQFNTLLEKVYKNMWKQIALWREERFPNKHYWNCARISAMYASRGYTQGPPATNCEHTHLICEKVTT
jgi:hypothetical protein